MRRPIFIIVGLAMLATSFAMVRAVDSGLTHAWSSSLRGAWVFGMIALVFAGVLALLVGAGLLSSATLAAVGTPGERSPTLTQFIAVYAGFLAIGIGSGIYFERFGIKIERSALVTVGVLYGIAAIGRPWWLFATLRRLGWFKTIGNDSHMRMVLAGLAALLVVVGAFFV
jgi:hypothetical protein